MSKYESETVETIPNPSTAILQGVRERVGFIPNVYAIIGESPSALTGFVGLSEAFSQSTFTGEEQQIIQLATSTENGCGYCVAGHTAFADNLNLPGDVVSAMREMRPVPNARLEALSKIVRSLVGKRGHVADNEIAAFLAAGYTKAQLLEVVLGISVKTFSNYVSIALKIPLDAEFKKYAWQKPGANESAAEQ